MPAQSTPPDFASRFEALKELLACPACHGSVRLQERELVCNLCEKRYSIVDGIPVLISDR